MAAIDHLCARIKADLYFLVEQNHLDAGEVSSFVSKLPKPGSVTEKPATTASTPSSTPVSMPVPSTTPTVDPPKYEPPQEKPRSIEQPEKPSRAVPPPPPARPTETPRKRVRAIWDYTATSNGDIGFRKGDVIEIIEECNEHWYKGTLNGQTGLLPVNHVEPFKDEPQPYYPPEPSHPLPTNVYSTQNHYYGNGQPHQQGQAAVTPANNENGPFKGKHAEFKKQAAMSAVGGASFGAAAGIVSNIF